MTLVAQHARGTTPPATTPKIIELAEERAKYAWRPMIPPELLDPEIGPIAIAVYSVLALHVDDQTGECFPSYQTIADRIGVSRMSVVRALKKLAAKGFIEVGHRSTDDGAQSSNLYRLPHQKTSSPGYLCGTPPYLTDTPGFPTDSRQQHPKTPSQQGYHTDTPPYHTDTPPVSVGYPNHTSVNKTSSSSTTSSTSSQTSSTTTSGVDEKRDDETVSVQTRLKKPLPLHGPAQQIVAAYCAAAGIAEPASYKMAVGIAAKLAKAGITPEDIPSLYAASCWGDGTADLGKMLASVDRWRQSRNGREPVHYDPGEDAYVAKMVEAERRRYDTHGWDDFALIERSTAADARATYQMRHSQNGRWHH